MQKKFWLALSLLGLIILTEFIAKFPVLFHALNTPPGYWFVKQNTFFDAWDINVYVSMIRYGQRAGMMVQNMYTTIPHPGMFVYQFYALLGVINRFLQLDPFLLFHLASVVTGIILILVVYHLTQEFFADTFFRLISTVVVVLGGGFGWLPYFYKAADIRGPGFTLYSALDKGHEGLSTACYLIGTVYLFRYWKRGRLNDLLISTAATVITVMIHPYMILLFLAISSSLLVWQVVKKIQPTMFWSIVPTSLFSAVYYFFVFYLSRTNPGFSGLIGQYLPKTELASYIAGVGILGLFLIWEFLFGSWKNEDIVFLKLCALFHLIFVYLPVGFSPLYIRGFFFWIVLLAFIGLKHLISNTRLQTGIALGVLIIALFSRGYIFLDLLITRVNNPFYFLPLSEAKAFETMKQFPADSRILSLYYMGNHIPAHTDNRVYYGHWFNTPNGKETAEQVKRFYLLGPAQQQKFLSDHGIDYVYYGSEERGLRLKNNLSVNNPFPHFSIVYQNEDVIIYRLDKINNYR